MTILSLKSFNELATGEGPDQAILFKNEAITPTAEEGLSTGVTDAVFGGKISGAFKEVGPDSTMVMNGAEITIGVPESADPETFAQEILEEAGMECKFEVTQGMGAPDFA